MFGALFDDEEGLGGAGGASILGLFGYVLAIYEASRLLKMNSFHCEKHLSIGEIEIGDFCYFGL